MTTRRKFITGSLFISIGTVLGIYPRGRSRRNIISNFNGTVKKPVVISTWNHGIPANEAAWKVLSDNGRALDAVESGVRVTEADPNITTVGYGGFPDRDGFVTLDACIMDEFGNAGSVGCIQNIIHPVSVARKVMEETPHVMLVGEGALQFALENGFKKENLLTEEAKEAWQKWLKENKYKPYRIDKDNHDTIGMIALDNSGNLSGACTTSGLSFKLHGRVGDSPIIGAGLFVDNEVGGAASTGKGEAVMKSVGCHLVVEYMRNGKTPQEACELAVKRIIEKQKDFKTFQVGYIALDKFGNHGAYSISSGFQYAVYSEDKNRLIDVESFLKR